MGAMAFGAEGLAAMTAEVAVVGMATIAPDGKGYVGNEQQIANIIKGEDAEYYIVNSTDSYQACQVQHSIEGGKVAECIINGRNGGDDDSPHRSDKEP